MLGIDPGWGLPAAGLAVGAIIGFVTRRSHFCTMAALERHWYAGDSNGLRAWVLAAAVALLLTQAMMALGVINVSQSVYLQPHIVVAGAIIGGLMFGVGMSLVGTCAFGSIVRLGGGNLRSLVVLTGVGLAAIAAQRGLTGHLRVWLIEPANLPVSPAPTQSLSDLFAYATGLNSGFLLPLAISLAAMAWVFNSAQFRHDHWKLVAGLTLGVGIASGWYITSTFASLLFDPVQVEAGSFVMPVGEMIMQVITVTGVLPDYGIGLSAGVLGGAAVAAWRGKDMRWEACDDARELGRHLVGAFLMGTGGVFAMGCTIGQGVSAMSVMSLTAPLSVASMVVGVRLGLSYLVEGNLFSFMRTARQEPAE